MSYTKCPAHLSIHSNIEDLLQRFLQRHLVSLNKNYPHERQTNGQVTPTILTTDLISYQQTSCKW